MKSALKVTSMLKQSTKSQSTIFNCARTLDNIVPDMKLIDVVDQVLTDKETNISFEFFPPKKQEQRENFWDHFGPFTAHRPLFMDVTWGQMSEHKAGDDSIQISSGLQNQSQTPVQMHLTIGDATEEKMEQVLDECREKGLRNILALRGDFANNGKWGSDLVKLMRKRHDDYFGICVAGYPEKHSLAPSLDMCVDFLKAKCDEGADFVITQYFWNPEKFIEFADLCKTRGITAPIIPGILIPLNYKQVQKMNEMCDVSNPDQFSSGMERYKDDLSGFRDFGADQMARVSMYLKEHGFTMQHLQTLNNIKTTERQLERMALYSHSEQQNVSFGKCFQKGAEPVQQDYQSTNQWDVEPLFK